MKKSTKLKIGFLLDDSMDRNDGVQQYVKTLGGWLRSKGHDVHYLAGQSHESKNVHSLSRNVGVKFNGNGLTTPLPARKNEIIALLKKEMFDVIHVQMPYSPFMAGKVIKYASGKTAIVGTFHILPYGGLQKSANKTLGVVQKRQFKRIDAICSVSGAAQDFAKSHYGLNSVVVPNMVDIKDLKSSVLNHPKRIVFLGRLVPRKGCMQFLRAINQIPENLRKDLEILIAGDGPQRKKLQNYVKTHGLNEVSFLGFIDEKQKNDFLASAELAVFPSTGGESFGIVLIESMAAGAGIVLGGDNPGYRSVLSSMPEVLFDPGKSLLFAEKIQTFLTNDKLRNSLHIKQREMVQTYDVNIVGDQIIELYSQAQLHRRQEMR